MKLKAGAAILGAMLALATFTNCPAEDSKYSFPEGCVLSGFEFGDYELILNTGSASAQNLYLFHNTSGGDIFLNHPVKDPGASAGWASMLGSGKWSAFALNKGDFALTCSEVGQGEYKQLACEKVLTACRFENPSFKRGQSGSYWVSEDKTLEAVLEDAKSRGIRW